MTIGPPGVVAALTPDGADAAAAGGSDETLAQLAAARPIERKARQPRAALWRFILIPSRVARRFRFWARKMARSRPVFGVQRGLTGEIDPTSVRASPEGRPRPTEQAMKVRNSLKSLKNRHKDCKLVRRRGRVYVINKTHRRYKARQG